MHGLAAPTGHTREATAPTEEIRMDDLPRYRDTRDDMAAQSEPDSTPTNASRTKVLLILIGVALVAVMVGLHLAGVTPH
jgi:hypothetical protein